MNNGFSGKRRNPYKLTIYVPNSKEASVKKFIEMFRATDESASQKILDFICREVEKNDPNWQKRLNVYMNGPSGILCGCGEKPDYITHQDGETIKLCSECFKKLNRLEGKVGYRKLKKRERLRTNHQ